MPSLDIKSQEWLDQVVEDVLEPDLAIVDPHHHLWPVGGFWPYTIAELTADLTDGHNVVNTVFVECHAAYRTDTTPDLASLGETEFVAGVAHSDPRRAIAGIVANVDLRLDHVDAVLDAHEAAGGGLLRGIRHAISRAEEPELLTIPGAAPKDLYLDPAFQRGVRRLGERSMTYDSWHYHYQIREFTELARAVPGTTMVHDHFGTPSYHGRYATRRDEVFEQWKRDTAELAKCDNVVAKIGGISMPDNGTGWNADSRPPTSDEYVARLAPYFLHTIEAFGPERCMFESNFPVDKLSLSYRTVWNAYKKISAGFSATERAALFSGTARRVYRLP